MWTYHSMRRFVGGRLPVPRVTNGTAELELLPCNPTKQQAYPNFVGYLKYYEHGKELMSFGVSITANGLTVPDKYAQIPDLSQGAYLLIELADKAGHVFPAGVTA